MNLSQLARQILLLTLPLLASCALPAPANDTAGFVPDRELAIVGLTREGLSYYKQSRFVDAEFKLRQALYLAPDADNIKASLAVTLGQLGETDEAEAILRDLSKKYPQASKFSVNLGELYAREHKFDQARIALKDGLEKSFYRQDVGSIATILRSLSVVEFNDGREEEALCRSADVLILKSDQPEIIRHSRTLIAMNRYAEAQTFLEGASNANRVLQQDPDVLRHLALATYGQGKFKEAVEISQRARDLPGIAPDIETDFKVLVYLGNQMVAEESKQTDAAITSETASEGEEDEFLFAQDLSEFNLLYWPMDLIKCFQNERTKRLQG